MHIKQLCMSRLNTMVKKYAIGSWKPVHASINLEILDTNRRSLHLPTTDIRITFPVSIRHTLICSSSISTFHKQDRFTSLVYLQKDA